MRVARLGLGLIGLSRAATASSSAEHEALEDCLSDGEVTIDTVDSTMWNLDAIPFNSLLKYTPAVIAVPSKTEHIQSAIACGAKLGYKVTAKCGGHSYGSYGLGGEDGHLVIQLDRMYTVTLDNETNIATSEPGARLGHLASELWKQGNRAVSHGTCPGVGIAGHALHGGFGLSSHTHGLALDWIAGLNVALANGSLVHCSAQENSDLFWGMLGAGSNFGVVTSFEWNTFAPPENLTSFTVSLPWTKTSAVAGLEAVEEFALSTMPAELNMRVVGTVSSAQLEGVYYGNEAGLRAALEPLLNVTRGSFSEVETTDWIGTLQKYAQTTNLDVTWPYSSQETFHSNAVVLNGLSGESAQNFVDYWFDDASKMASGTWYYQLDIQGGNNSAIWNSDATLSSYAHRDKLYILSLFYQSSTTSIPGDVAQIVDGWVSATTKSLDASDWGMYINYPDLSMNRTMAQSMYWGDSMPRLRQLKAEYDADELFYYPVSVDPGT